MLNYDIFYRRNAVRLPAHLMLPYLPTIDKFQFPLDSIHHYMSWDSVLDGPESGEYFYRDIQKKIYVEHIQQLTSDKGAPKKTALMLMQLIRQYHMRNKRFRYADKPTETISDPYTLVTINYCPVAKGYRYVRSIYADYYKWWNLQKTMWSKAVEVAQYSGRQQFMFFDLPEKLPSMNTLNIHANKFTDKTVRNLGGPNSWFLLEIWKWLSQEHRYESVIGDVSQESLKKLNIIFKESGRYVVINLGTINSWRYIKGQELEGQKTKIAPIDLQKRFLKLLMTMMALRSSVVVDDEINTDEESGVKISVNPTEVSASGTDDGEKSASEIAQSLLDSLDEDLATLEELSSDEDDGDDLPKEHSQSSVSLDDFKIGETPEEVLKKVCDDLADNGALTAAEYRRFLNLSENYKKIKSPFSNEPLSEFASVSNKDLVIDSYKFEDIATVPDKTMLKNSLVEFDEQYIKHVLNKDIASMVVNSQKGGFVINKYDVERVENISGKFDIHTVRITPIEGLPSTLRFNIPVLDEEGVYVSGGVRYRQRKQRGDAPFRKTDPDRVAMTTYFGKTFVSRSDKKVNDYGAWLREQVMKKGMDTSDKDISNLSPANIFDNEYDTSRSYTSLAMGFKSFDAKGYHFILDRNSDSFSEEAKKYNKDGNAVIAVNDSGEHLVVDKSGVVYSIGKDGLDPKGSLESFLGINVISAPVDFAQVKVYGKNLPVGIVLGYMYGLDNLFEKFKITPRRVAAGQRLNLQENEFSIAFADETLIFSRDDQFASMIFGGFKEFEKSLKNFSAHTFDKKNVYLNVLESQGIGVRYLREIEMFNDMFVDPISKGLLEDKGLPSTFPGLLIEASKALLTDAHPDTLDMEYMRIKGYERFAGAVYAEVCQAVREHRTKSGKKHQQIELNPHAVWKRIARDPSVTTSSGINPIKNLKEKEAVTYNGVGGRTSRSMVRTTRAYHKNDMGVISESTVDSSDVGINTFLTADPQFNSLRGTTKRVNLKNAGVTPMLSTSAQLSVGSMHDDPKRVNFVGVQQEHGVACNGYTQGMVRTGYEQVIAQRTGDMFCFSARKPGTVISVKPNGIVVQYEDGEVKGVETGRRYGSDSGLVFAHNVKTNYKVGDSFNKGDVLTYNEGFFEPDFFNPKNMVWKQGVMVNTVLLESTQTLEDASSISRKLASKLTTKTTKVKIVKLTFDQVVRNMVTAGTPVNHETILCVIEDAVTSNSNLFDEVSLDTLRILSSQTPTAKVQGVVERIEVYYHGDKEDMSDSLRAIADTSDRAFAEQARAAGKKAYTGEVGEELRFDGDPLTFETLAIKFYITTDVPSGVGDKGVFSNQMKTVFSEVMDYEVTTERGEVVDAIFGAKSILDRIVLSPILIGTTNKLLELIAAKAVDVYFE